MAAPKVPQAPAAARFRAFLPLTAAFSRAPLDLRIVGRTLLHAALVGAAAGVLGLLFFGGLELTTRLLLEKVCGYVPLRAGGEPLGGPEATRFRWWLLLFLPACGALLSGLLGTFVAKETAGGGTDATIDAFHNHGGVVRRRVVVVKILASSLTLGSGGSGGREGPTIQIGGAIGSVVARYLKVDTRERRILLVAGAAAGMAAVFRTPLGAALLAVEVLYRDDFESDALIPALLASVVSYSVFISYYGESTLFAHDAHYAFIPAHLPIFVAMAVFVALTASIFLTTRHAVQTIVAKVKVPPWARAAMGGLGVGMVATPVIYFIGPRVSVSGQGFGILGGGYGIAQVAITGEAWLPHGWRAVELLLLLGIVKMIVTALTVGSGGSAGDFGPSLVMGGLFGGAFGYAAQVLFHDPRINPGAFALVGMGTFYGGIAHVPVSSLVMTCELAGSYDLLVPLMLAEGVAFVALRNRSLYHTQVGSRAESPAHRTEQLADALSRTKVSEILIKNRPYVTFHRNARPSELVQKIAAADWQDVFPVIGDEGSVVGIIDGSILRTLTTEREIETIAVAADIMHPTITVNSTDDLHTALAALLKNETREMPVVDENGQIVGFLDEADITRAYLEAAVRAKM
ncbi:MAG: chloride channel protein [Polyangiales bacterium]